MPSKFVNGACHVSTAIQLVGGGGVGVSPLSPHPNNTKNIKKYLSFTVSLIRWGRKVLSPNLLQYKFYNKEHNIHQKINYPN